jgi:hypothetical protein
VIKTRRSKTARRAQRDRARKAEKTAVGLSAYREAQLVALAKRPTAAVKKDAAKQRKAARFSWKGPTTKPKGLICVSKSGKLLGEPTSVSQMPE